MAKSVISGLTIQIGANTKGFTDALKEIQKEAKQISKDLKTVNENLKLDSKNIATSADKLKLLQEQAQNAAKKVQTITAAIEAFKKSRPDSMSDDYKKALADLERQLESAKREQDLANKEVEQFGKNADEAGKKTISFGDLIKANLISDAIKAGLHAVADAAKAIGTAVWDAVKTMSKAVWDFSRDSMSIAEENRQTLAKVGQVFGELKGQIVDWSQGAATAMGLTSSEAQAAAATFGNMFAALDVGIVKTDKIDTNFAQMSMDLVQLAADVAAFNNVTTADVLDAFQSGLAGTSRQLREYGIVITAALVEQKALELGLKSSKDELTEGDKIIARYALMMEQAAHQTGQFARESDSATVQAQVLKALVKEFQGQIGEKLLPIQAKLYELINRLISNPAVQEFLSMAVDKVGELADAFISLFDGIDTADLSGTFTEMFSQLMDQLELLLPSVFQFAEELIKMIIDGINKNLPLLLSAAPSIITTIVNGIAQNLPEIAKGALQILTTLGEAIITNLPLLAPSILTLVEGLVQFIFDNLPKVFQAAIDIVVELAEGIADALPKLVPAAVSMIMELVKTLINNLPKIYQAAADLMAGLAEGILKAIPKVVEALPDIITGIVDFFIQQRLTIAQAGWDLLVCLVENLPQIIESIIVGVAEIIAGILNYFRDHGGEIRQAGVDLLTQIWEGIKSMASWFENNFTSWLSGIWSKVKSIFKRDAHDDAVDEFTDGDNGTWISDDASLTGSVRRTSSLIRTPASTLQAYVPSGERWIGSASTTENMVNNNYSRTISGGINIYVNSYGMDVSEVADELGAAFQAKLRMSGAML